MWELHGESRGALLEALEVYTPPVGWERALTLVTVGLSGYWPHVMVFWHGEMMGGAPAWLATGPDDGLAEERIWWGESRLYTTAAGALDGGRRAYLVERLVAVSPEDLAPLTGPDLVLAEAFAPWQGLALWGADDAAHLAARQAAGVGARGERIRAATAWWAVSPPRERTLST